jgi:hypothetical protein
MATVDGQLFRTEAHERRKRTKTANKYIVGAVNVTTTGSNGKKVTKKQKCYGVIKKIYLHFMYPPARSTYKLNIRKLAAFKEPWILCARCDWYEELGCNPITEELGCNPGPTKQVLGRLPNH